MVSARSTHLLGAFFICAGTVFACIRLQYMYWAFILYVLGVVLIWYAAQRPIAKVLWTILPPLIWLVTVLVLIKGTH